MAAINFTKNPRHFPRCTKFNFFTAATLGASGPNKTSLCAYGVGVQLAGAEALERDLRANVSGVVEVVAKNLVLYSHSFSGEFSRLLLGDVLLVQSRF